MLTTSGDCTVRVSADAAGSHAPATVGSNVSPFGSTILTGTSSVFIVVDGAVWTTKGFLPTIVNLNELPRSLTVEVNLLTVVVPVSACDWEWV